MRIRKLYKLLVFIAFVVPLKVPAAELSEILEQQRQVATGLQAGDLVVTPRERSIVQQAQTEVFTIADGKASLADLSIAEKTRMENALERINAVVKGGRRAQEIQEVCWRERASGSKLMKTRCGTQQEIDQAREGARGYLQRPRVCAPPGCGS